MAINANANGIPFLKRYGIPPAIKNSMVLWYDIKRQGATNESMAENPILKDLSGNGHDATCYNFAWSGMSGVGGYTENFTDSSTFYNWADRNVHTVTGNTIHITEINSSYSFFARKIKDGETSIDSLIIRISGISESGLTLFINYQTKNLLTIEDDGEYVIPAITEDEFVKDYAYYWNMMFDKVATNKTCNITIEQLPLYPNALVSDGVDDYAQVTGLPLLTKERGYTVIAKRKFTENVIGDNCLSVKGISVSGGAFIFEYKETSTLCNSFGTLNSVVFTDDDITVQRKDYYNNVKLNVGNKFDDDKLYIFSLIGERCFSNIALYSFLLFDRDLTEQEIEWVKKNMIEGGTEI